MPLIVRSSIVVVDAMYAINFGLDFIGIVPVQIDASINADINAYLAPNPNANINAHMNLRSTSQLQTSLPRGTFRIR